MKSGSSHFVVGVVEELHPEKAGLVRVTFPHLKIKSGWCPVVMPMGGAGRGFVFLPEKGDHVMVALEHGDPQRGFIIGAFWKDGQKAPESDGKPKENNVRFIKSRCGHLLRFDDTKGKESIEIIDMGGDRKIVIDTAKKKIQVIAKNGDIEVESGGGKVSVKASGEVSVEGATVTIKSKGSMNVEAEGVLTLKGKMVNIN